MRPAACVLVLVASWLLVEAVPAQTMFGSSGLVAEKVVDTGLFGPTTLAFLGPDEFLILQRFNGQVKRVVNGVVDPTPVLDVPVNSLITRGLLGIAINTESPPGVFLHYTEAAVDNGPPLGNRTYRYDWNAGLGVLENPQLVLDLPAGPGFLDGGVVLLGPPGEGTAGDGSLLYAVIGSLQRQGQLQNFVAGAAPDDTSVIVRVEQDGTPAAGNPFTAYCDVTTTTTCVDSNDCPMGETCLTQVERYYAYGIRNSFGLALDPVTGDLWDTENGDTDSDEINRVLAGMNSGWETIMGPESASPGDPNDLFDMPGAGSTYDDPEFTWFVPAAPAPILLPHSSAGSALGAAYDDMVLVGDTNNGFLYAVPLNGARDDLDLSAFFLLADRVADTQAEANALRIGAGFGVITDLDIGPDGFLYLVSLSQGAVYRIRPGSAVPLLPWSAFVLLGVLAGTGGALLRRRE